MNLEDFGLKPAWHHMLEGMPLIVTICGSTRYKEEFIAANAALTLGGYAVLTVGTFPHADGQGNKEESMGPEVAEKLDTLHKAKITLSNLIVVLNVNNYIGSSTRGEIEHAKKLGIPVHYLETAR